MKKAEAIIIGSGQGGVPLAAELAQQGKEVGLFERGALGGKMLADLPRRRDIIKWLQLQSEAV